MFYALGGFKNLENSLFHHDLEMTYAKTWANTKKQQLPRSGAIVPGCFFWCLSKFPPLLLCLFWPQSYVMTRFRRWFSAWQRAEVSIFLHACHAD